MHINVMYLKLIYQDQQIYVLVLQYNYGNYTHMIRVSVATCKATLVYSSCSIIML